jgi:hypothetical protein
MSKQGQHIAIDKKYAEMFKTQSAILFPPEKGVRGPKGSCGRFLIIAAIMLAKRIVFVDGRNKGKRVFSDEYLKPLVPKDINLRMYSSHLK